MSQENVELARRTYAALNVALATGEFREAIETFFDPRILIKPSGTFPETSELHGHEGVLRFLALNTEAFEDFQVAPQEFIDAGTPRPVAKVLALKREAGTSSHVRPTPGRGFLLFARTA